jgi:hypothetical protein
MVIPLTWITFLFLQEPHGKKLQLDSLEQRHQAFVSKRSDPLLIPKALMFSLDDESSIRDIIEERNEWIKSELALIQRNGKQSNGVQIKDGVLSCEKATRPDLFSIETVLLNFSMSYLNLPDKNFESDLVERGFRREDLVHIRDWLTPGHEPLEVINRMTSEIAWQYPEESVFVSIAQKKYVTDEELEAQVAMEEAAEHEAKVRWVESFLRKLSRQSRRVILSYTFNEANSSLREHRYVDQSQYTRNQVLVLRSMIADLNSNPALQKRLQNTLREKINESKKH